MGSTCPAGEGALAGYRVVDGVQTGRANVPGRFGHRVCGSFGGQAYDDIVQVGQEFIGRQVDVGQGANGGAKSPHGGGCLDAVADHAAHHQGDAGSGQWDDVVPVAAHAGLGPRGQVAVGDLHRRLLCDVLRKQAALEREGGVTRMRVAAGVIDGHRRPGGEFLGEEQILVVEEVGVAVSDELRDAHSRVSGPHRHHQRRVGPGVADTAGITGPHRADVPRGLTGDQSPSRWRTVRTDMGLLQPDRRCRVALHHWLPGDMSEQQRSVSRRVVPTKHAVEQVDGDEVGETLGGEVRQFLGG